MKKVCEARNENYFRFPYAACWPQFINFCQEIIN